MSASRHHNAGRPSVRSAAYNVVNTVMHTPECVFCCFLMMQHDTTKGVRRNCGDIIGRFCHSRPAKQPTAIFAVQPKSTPKPGGVTAQTDWLSNLGAMNPRAAASHSGFAGCSTCFQRSALRCMPRIGPLVTECVKVQAPKDVEFGKESRIGKAPIKVPRRGDSEA